MCGFDMWLELVASVWVLDVRLQYVASKCSFSVYIECMARMSVHLLLECGVLNVELECVY